LELNDILLLIGGGFLAGLIDSVVGGGGLISVPVFLLILGPNASAIGTNKVAAVGAQIAAVWVYFKNSQVDLSRAWKILTVTCIGSVIGALCGPHLPPAFYKWFLVIVAPTVLILVFTRKLWTRPLDHPKHPRLALVGSFAAGFYDGIAGPGGGTLMFLSLFLLGGMPATIAMGTGKLANFGSASFGLVTYAAQGNVNWSMGLVMLLPVSLGAWIGARYSSSRSQEVDARKLARTALVIVSGLLLARWLMIANS
jgi:uncharacterized membrane protein YfcA